MERPFIQLVLFCLGSGLLFYTVTGRSFVSDDFAVMKRVGMDKVIWIKGFFRPLSDITLYFNYLLDGFHPAGYYWLNILIHGVSSYLLFLFCLHWKWTEEKGLQRKYAFIAALLFLAYPFHNESVVWLLGRASLVANLFGIVALLMVVSDLSAGWRIAGACLFYFIGMASYESIMLLPLMVLIIQYDRGKPVRQYVSWGMALGGTLLAHLAVRIAVSGGVVGSYGNGFLGSRLMQYGGNLFKVTGRLFLPPVEDSHRMLLWFGLLVAGWSGAVVVFLRRTRGQAVVRSYFYKLFLLLTITCAVPVLSGVSTRTSEGDRLLYFPSFFVCCGVAFWLVSCLRGNKWLSLPVLGLVIGGVVLIEKNNRNWVRASDMTRGILSVIRRQPPGKKIFLVNLPEELDGAYIFRVGLPEALLMNGMDTSGVTIVNQLGRLQELVLPDSIAAGQMGGEWQIAPMVGIRKRGTDSLEIWRMGSAGGQGSPDSPGADLRQAAGGAGTSGLLPGVRSERAEGTDAGETAQAGSWFAGKDDIVLYWNKKRLLRWAP